MDQLDTVLSQLRDEYSPDAGARRRVRSTLAASIAMGAVVGTAGSQAAAAAGGTSAGAAKGLAAGNLFLWGKVVAGVGASAAIAVAGMNVARSSETPPEPKSVVPRTVAVTPDKQTKQAEPAIESSTTTDSASAEPTPDKAAVERKRAVVTRAAANAAGPQPSSMLDEFRLLREASQELRAGHLGDAQRRLDEHGRRFPKTSLDDERRGLALLVSCANATTPRNRAEAARFVQAAPTSPLADSVRRRCVK